MDFAGSSKMAAPQEVSTVCDFFKNKTDQSQIRLPRINRIITTTYPPNAALSATVSKNLSRAVIQLTDIYDFRHGTMYSVAFSTISGIDFLIIQILFQFKCKFCFNGRLAIHSYQMGLRIRSHNSLPENNSIVRLLYSASFRMALLVVLLLPDGCLPFFTYSSTITLAMA